MTTKKTLFDEVSEIMNSKATKATKKRQLKKVGLRDADIYQVFFAWQHGVYKPAFDIDGLTFGVEMEITNAPHRAVCDAFRANGVDCRYEGYTHTTTPHFKLVTDSSLSGVDTIECVSPVLKGEDGENAMKQACDALATIGARVNRSCGLHVHFGASEMTDEHYTNIFKNYQLIEDAIDEIMPQSRKANNSQWCRSLKTYDLSKCSTKRDLSNTIYTRYTKVNVEAYRRHQTIEFRQHSGTTNYTKIINWVKFLKDLIKFSAKNVLTEEIHHVEDLHFVSDEVMAYLKARKSELNQDTTQATTQEVGDVVLA